MTMMDSRVAERRRNVSEDKARRRLRWILAVLAIVVLAAAVFWLLRSPLLSISAVEITGAVESDPAADVAELQMGVGRPTIDVDAGALERRIAADPWVASVTVSVMWPGTLGIDVVEHRPVAPVPSGGEWVMAASDGSIIEVSPAPGPVDPAVDIDVGAIAPGDVVEDALVVGSLEFIDALPADLREGARLTGDADGVWATVAGHEVRLGRPTDMAMKARVLASLVASGLEPGSSINLIAPSRPAVANPQPQGEAEDQVQHDAQPEG